MENGSKTEVEIEYDGDPEAPSWPVVTENVITSDSVVMGHVLNVPEGYQARREAGGLVHVGPLRVFAEEAANDLAEWVDNPLGTLHVWTEILDGGE